MNVVHLFTKGFEVDDFDTLLPNLVLLSAIMPPSSMNGIELANQTKDILNTQSPAYTVRRIPDAITHDGTTVAYIADLKVGDIVVLRNAMLDTMHVKRDSIVDIDIRHIKARLKRQPPKTPEATLVREWLTESPNGPKVHAEMAEALIRDHAQAAMDAAEHAVKNELTRSERVELVGRVLLVSADPVGFAAWGPSG